jgi:hypothetical protein
LPLLPHQGRDDYREDGDNRHYDDQMEQRFHSPHLVTVCLGIHRAFGSASTDLGQFATGKASNPPPDTVLG